MSWGNTRPRHRLFISRRPSLHTTRMFQYSKINFYQFHNFFRWRKNSMKRYGTGGHCWGFRTTKKPTSVPDPWHYGTDPNPALFVSDLQDANKNNFFYKFLWNTLISFWKDKKSSSHKTVEKKSRFFCLSMERSGQKITDPGDPKNCTDPTDPEHWNQKKPEENLSARPQVITTCKNFQDKRFLKKANESLRIPRYHLDPHLLSRTKADSRHSDIETDHLETKKLPFQFLPDYTPQIRFL